MSKTITVVCCDCEKQFWDEEVSDSLAESYEEEVQQIYDHQDGQYYPDTDSFSTWARNHDFPHESCSNCGSDGSLSGWVDKD